MIGSFCFVITVDSILFGLVAASTGPGGEILNDEMSLSSLSSGDEKILNSEVTPAPTFVGSFYPPPSGYTAGDPYFAWRNMYGNTYPTGGPFIPAVPGAAPPPYGSFSYPPPNGCPPYVDYSQPAMQPPTQNAEAPAEENPLDVHAATIE